MGRSKIEGTLSLPEVTFSFFKNVISGTPTTDMTESAS